ncbi:laccase-14 isoform X2 [Spinacia oleracea]|uniref:laccase n=1 Tax=Spinacia oleracea TaxID=3562 RepID=A0ABM3QGC7_SPIOL|nr:laccase-14-like isoform X2 [Spinacia oleracea]
MKFSIIFQLLLSSLLFFHNCHQCQATKRYRFELREAKYRRLCRSKKILTVNGKFPGPTISAHRGDTVIVDVINNGNYNVTIHWHGAPMNRYPWTDGPEYITQCPIPPGGKFKQRIILGDEEGTIWWHAHSNWTRATVHGAFIIYPTLGTIYPFPKPHAQLPIILDTFKLKVVQGKTYLLRIINAVMQNLMFFGVANHKLTVVGSDGSYTKPFTSNYIAISPGQTIDVLLEANQTPKRYYMAARVYERTLSVSIDNTTTTAIIQYDSLDDSTPPLLPILPNSSDLNASIRFTNSLRSLASKDHPVKVPLKITKRLFYTLSINTLVCQEEDGNTCQGPNNTRLAASVNNISFVNPNISILEAYYHNMINGNFMTNFPDKPPKMFNYTAPFLPIKLELPKRGTKVKVLDYNETVELTFQGTSVVDGADHPMHLHGYSFYVVGSGLGNFDKDKDPFNYNLVDPPFQNTIAVPYKGWTTIRFRANNPGVWFMHCHVDRHLTWGMETVFIVTNGKTPESRILPPPPDMPPC